MMQRQLPKDFDLAKDGDRLVSFGDGDYARKMTALSSEIDAEIAAAGGIDAWRAQHTSATKQRTA